MANDSGTLDFEEKNPRTRSMCPADETGNMAVLAIAKRRNALRIFCF